jgi:hypothetical protein
MTFDGSLGWLASQDSLKSSLVLDTDGLLPFFSPTLSFYTLATDATSITLVNLQDAFRFSLHHPRCRAASHG